MRRIVGLACACLACWGAGLGGVPVAVADEPDLRDDLDVKIREVVQRANEDDPAAQIELGESFAKGTQGLSRNPAAAMHWYDTATAKATPDQKSGMARSLNAMGTELSRKNGVEQLDEGGLAALERASALGDAKAQFNQALLYLKFKPPGEKVWMEKAFHLLSDAGDHLEGDSRLEAQTDLARMYERGLGTPRDTERAMRLYREAADKGNMRARYFLALAYLEGNDPSKKTEAIHLLEQAKDQKFPPAAKVLEQLKAIK